MYQLLFVEDDKQKREHIIECVDFNACGFHLVGQAGDGHTALDIAKESRPDLVITDIKMPYMDGLQLCHELSRLVLPSPKMVIMSGYSEFEYAKTALSLNIVEYLLKPVALDDFIGLLEKIRAMLDEEKASKENLLFLKDHYQKSLPLLKEKFIQSLLTGHLSNYEIDNKIKQYDLNLTGDAYVVSLLQVNTLNADEQYALLKKDNDLISYAAFNVASEISAKHWFVSCYLLNEIIVCIFVFNQQTPYNMIHQCNQVNEEIIHSVDKFLNTSLTCGIGSIENAPYDLHVSYENALTALKYRIIYGSKKTIYIGDVERKTNEQIIYNDKDEYQLIHILKMGSGSDLEHFYNILFKKLNQCTFDNVQLTIVMLLSSLMKTAYSFDIQTRDLSDNTHLLHQLLALTDIALIKKWFLNLSAKIMHSIQKERQDTLDALIEKSKAYVHAHFHDHHLTISKICKHLFVSQSYFCSVFKKQMNDTFTNYLTRVRMEKSQQLLITSSEKVYTIAQKVGYADSNYFSFCFKKYTGMSPTEYRAQF